MITMRITDPERWKKRRAVLKLRDDPKFGPVRDIARQLDGREVVVRYAWSFEPGERTAYRKAGDVAWEVLAPAEATELGWVATGDLAFVEGEGPPRRSLWQRLVDQFAR